MERKTENTKDQTYFTICSTVTKLELTKGHLKWRISDIANISGVTRSLIYYYFGKDKKVILEESCRYLADFFYVSGEFKKKSFVDRIYEVSTILKNMPYLFVIFYLERQKNTDMGKMFRKAEQALIKKYTKEFPHLDSDQINQLYIIILGLIAQSNITIEDIEKATSEFTTP